MSDWMRRILTLAAGVGLLTGIAFGLNQWSAWWPHADMRQTYGTGFQYLAASVAFILAIRLLIRWRRPHETITRTTRIRVVSMIAITSMLGWLVTYQGLVATTLANK